MSDQEAIPRVVLIDRLPSSYIDVLYTDPDGGFVATADVARIRELQGEGVSVAILFESDNAHAGAMYGKSEKEAQDLMRERRRAALSRLPPATQARFRAAGG